MPLQGANPTPSFGGFGLRHDPLDWGRTLESLKEVEAILRYRKRHDLAGLLSRALVAPHEVERITDAQRIAGVVRRLTGVGQRRRVVVAQFHRSCACWPNSGEEFERGRLQLKLTRFWQKSCAIMCVY